MLSGIGKMFNPEDFHNRISKGKGGTAPRAEYGGVAWHEHSACCQTTRCPCTPHAILWGENVDTMLNICQ